jgi:quinol monooxygenase YgiN
MPLPVACGSADHQIDIDTKEHAAVTTPTDNNPNLLTVIASLRAKPGSEDQLRTALGSLLEPTRKEDGNVNYDLHEAVDQPGLFYFYENWESAQALQQHMGAPHMVEALGAAQELLAEPPSIAQVKRIG